MYRISREIRFCYGHRLVEHEGKDRHFHGHNGRAIITVESDQLDKLGMVVDIGCIKKVVGEWIDANLDHRMLLHRDDPALPSLKEMGEALHVMDVPPTAENIAKLIFDYASQQNLAVCEVQFFETDRNFASYCG